jgi:hypothetical protein
VLFYHHFTHGETTQEQAPWVSSTAYESCSILHTQVTLMEMAIGLFFPTEAKICLLSKIKIACLSWTWWQHL